jgi:hypothetical protein
MSLTRIIFTLISVILVVSAGNAFAKVSVEEAAKLGNDHTPSGAEKAGNKEGTIPEWTGGFNGAPAGWKPGESYIDPFAEDSILFTIDKTNMSKYADKLTIGQQAMLKTYGDFKMPVYKTRRTANFTEAMTKMINSNAVNAELQENGNGLKNFLGAYPFPIPQNGLEVIWNHIQRNKGGCWTRKYVHVTPTASGDFNPVSLEESYCDRYALQDFASNTDDNLMFYFKQAVVGPARLAGNVLLVHETINQVKEPRRAWIYNAGQRRVRRAPQVAYDSPGTASDGLRTSDDFDMYNGAPDRYTWKLIGKQELYVPYNSYKLDSKSLKYDDLIKAGHLNSQYTRYELHRVWKVEAQLKPESRHIYKKRVFYLDEDSWLILALDSYDNRDEIWRVGEAHNKYFFDANAIVPTIEVNYDLLARRYMATGLSNEGPVKFSFNQGFSSKDFTPAALRRSSKQ